MSRESNRATLEALLANAAKGERNTVSRETAEVIQARAGIDVTDYGFEIIDFTPEMYQTEVIMCSVWDGTEAGLMSPTNGIGKCSACARAIQFAPESAPFKTKFCAFCARDEATSQSH